MQCLEDNYESPFEYSSSEDKTEMPPLQPTHRDYGTQTTKKSNKDAELEELQREVIKRTEERDELQDRLYCALNREKRLK